MWNQDGQALLNDQILQFYYTIVPLCNSYFISFSSLSNCKEIGEIYG